MQEIKSKIKFIFLFLLILVLPVFLLKENRIILAKKNTNIYSKDPFNQVEVRSQTERSFVFVVLTHNNETTIEKNLKSIMAQCDHPFRVIYLDRGSTDYTVSLLHSLIEREDKKNMVTVGSYQTDTNLFESYYNVVKACNDDDVIVHLSGNDVLAHEAVLNLLNQAYTNPDVWLTYGQYLDSDHHLKGKEGPYPRKTLYRKRVQKAPWDSAYFKTFYAGIYKKAMSQAIISPVFSLSLPSQEAFLKPISEMGKSHVQFIPEVLYIHSQTDQQKESGVKLTLSSGKIGEAFSAAVALKKQTFYQEKELADMIIFSHETPLHLNICLNSICEKLRGLHQLYIVCTGSRSYLSDYKDLEKKFPMVSFIYPDMHLKDRFKESVISSLIGGTRSPSYVILSTDEVKIDSPISLASCIEAMRQASAYGFYLHLPGKRYTHSSSKEKGIYSWVIAEGKEQKNSPNTLEMGLYRKIDLERDFKEMDFSNVEELKNAWQAESHIDRIGLAFEEPKTQAIENISSY